MPGDGLAAKLSAAAMEVPEYIAHNTWNVTLTYMMLGCILVWEIEKRGYHLHLFYRQEAHDESTEIFLVLCVCNNENLCTLHDKFAQKAESCRWSSFEQNM